MKIAHLMLVLMLVLSVLIVYSPDVIGGKSRWETGPNAITFETQCVAGAVGNAFCQLTRGDGWSCINFRCQACPDCPPGDDGPTTSLGGETAFCSSTECADIDGSCVADGGVSADSTKICSGGTWVDNCVNGAIVGVCNTATCGASSQCDGLSPSTVLSQGFCDASCVYTDFDVGASACSAGGFDWRTGGETAAFGQYDTGTSTECCTDDAGENSLSRQTNCNKAGCTANDFPAIGADAGDAVCCNSPNDCVFNGVCFTSNAENAGPYNLGLTPNDLIVLCEPGSGIWYDCDNSQGACTEPASTGRCGLNWVAGGEAAAFGEYATGTATECCGDDSGEFYRNTPQGIVALSACCNLATDCADTDGSCVADGTASTSSDYVCTGGSWVDVDADAAACAAVGGQFGIIGEPAGSEAISQFDRETDILIEGESRCCLPADDCFFRTRECAIGICDSDLTDNAICDKATDCVFNGICFSDIDEVVSSSSLTFADETAVWSDTLFRNEVSTDVNGNFIAEFCDPGEWQGGATGNLIGTVSNATDPVVPDVVVRVLGTIYQDITDAAGQYSITGIPEGTYDVTATQPEGLFQTALDVVIPGFGVTTQDFVLAHPSGECLDDCTKADGLCHAECQGLGLCSFASAETQSACDFASPGLINYGEQNINCCQGAPFTPVQANIEVCGDNVISLKKPVLFKGQLVNMVITVFNAAECPSS